jgi:hypothetical protein
VKKGKKTLKITDPKMYHAFLHTQKSFGNASKLRCEALHIDVNTDTLAHALVAFQSLSEGPPVPPAYLLPLPDDILLQ